MMLDALKNLIKSASNIHIPGNRPDVFVFATPRGGSTWFMELVCSQKGFRYCSEPLNIRSGQVRHFSGISTWEELYEPETSQKYRNYFSDIINGRVSFRNPNPFREYYRPITHRMVFKVIHGGVDRINWFRDEFNARILLCLRHPIPVSLSRVDFPFLERFLDSKFREQFSGGQQDMVAHMIKSGSKLQKGVTAWCVHNAIPLKSMESDWAVVTYEQAVVQPEPVIDYLCRKLDLPDPDRVYRRLNIPSRSVVLSNNETKDMLKRGMVSNNRNALIEKWKSSVAADDISDAQKILDIFEIDIYKASESLPSSAYWIGDKVDPVAG